MEVADTALEEAVTVALAEAEGTTSSADATQRTCARIGVRYGENRLKRCGWAYLASVHVVAVDVELGVVLVEHGGVHAVDFCDAVAGLAGGDDVGGRAVGADVAKAEVLTRLEVVAAGVDAGVDGRELVAEGRKTNMSAGRWGKRERKRT